MRAGSTQGVAICADLGDGSVDGTGTALPARAAQHGCCGFSCTGGINNVGQIIALQLNAAALADLSARRGGCLAVGFSLDDSDATSAVFNADLKGIRFRADFSEACVPAADLVLQEAQVPEPGSLPMVAAAAWGRVITSIRAG